jgi:hypothetical protein
LILERVEGETAFYTVRAAGWEAHELSSPVVVGSLCVRRNPDHVDFEPTGPWRGAKVAPLLSIEEVMAGDSNALWRWCKAYDYLWWVFRLHQCIGEILKSQVFPEKVMRYQ